MQAKWGWRIYAAAVLLLGAVCIAVDAIWFLQSHSVEMDGAPMSPAVKGLFTLLSGAVTVSWVISLVAVVGRLIGGTAWRMDETGIHSTLNGTILFAFIFVIPVKHIPWAAVSSLAVEDGVLTARIDKKAVSVFPIFRPFLRKSYHFCQGFTEKTDINEIQNYCLHFMKPDVSH